MKKKAISTQWKRLGLFVIEVLIPFIAVPLLPSYLGQCTEADAFIIGSCVSIFIAVWTLTNKVNDDHGEFDFHRADTRKGFDNIDQRLNAFGSFFKFERELDSITNPYFRKRILDLLQQNLEIFKKDNAQLFEGYIETTPYSNDTYGIDGIKTTRNEILAVSSVKDYWDRTGFATEYLKTQYCLIKDRSVTIKRIFIGTKDKLQRMSAVMKDQQANGVEVYYIESDSDYCHSSWCTEDFLIQDGTLLVDLQVKSHKPTDNGHEIITTKESLVHSKMNLFQKMLNSATKLDA